MIKELRSKPALQQPPAALPCPSCHVIHPASLGYAVYMIMCPKRGYASFGVTLERATNQWNRFIEALPVGVACHE